MALPSIDGKYLVDRASEKLGGYANAVDPNVLLSLINEGKDEVWAILKDLRADWFVKSSQSATSTADDYFGLLATNTREYNLPADFHEMKFIEVLTSGYETLEFVYTDMTHSDFKDARRYATLNNDSSLSASLYHYDIVGQRTFILAEYPIAVLELRLWYVRWITDLELDTALTEVLHPYAKRITDYAVRKQILSSQDASLWQAWRDEWSESVKRIEKSAGPRQVSDAVYVESFTG